MKKKRPVRSRTETRERDRQAQKLLEARTKLSLLEPGGSPERALEVSSASVVEARAEGEPCLRCGGALRCAEHTTVHTSRGLVRDVRLACRSCGSERHVYLRIVEKLLN